MTRPSDSGEARRAAPEPEPAYEPPAAEDLDVDEGTVTTASWVVIGSPPV